MILIAGIDDLSHCEMQIIPAEHKYDHIRDVLFERVEMRAETWKINTNQSLVLRHRSMAKYAAITTRRW